MDKPSAAPAPLTITLFGPLLVLIQGQPIPHLRSRKAQWLLALLALRHGRPVGRDWLAGVLWPDVDQAKAFANLRPTLSDLRTALGDEATRIQSPNRHSLTLDLAGAEIDLLAFDDALANKTPAGYEEAVRLYRGPLLEGCTEEWVVQDREARAQGCLRALQALAAMAAAAGRQDAAIDYWQQAVSMDPLSEALRRELMEALSQKGDSNEALEVYRTLARLLSKDDPRALPNIETTALYNKILASLRSRATAPLPARPESTAPPVVAAPTVEGHLPHALTDLIGREDDRLQVAALLKRSRLVTLFGVGGIGKTRLAIGVASDIVGEYPDGVRLVTLDSLSDGGLVAGQIASVLGVKEAAGKSLLQSVAEHLQGKRLLLVLDNCEHLLQASADAAAHLLRECSGVRVLTTSREALGITGETVWTVPPLAVPEPDHLPQGKAVLRQVLLGYDGIKLFVERAQAVQNTFELTADNALWTARLCAKLDGIPLGIELAAGRIRALTVEQIATNLEDRLSHPGTLGHLRLLTGGSRTAQHRQQTLRGAIDWSYDLLSERERCLFRRLSVFAGGWDIEAAEAVCTGEGIETEDVLDLLSSLADKSLIVFDPSEAGGRFRLLEMVRQYGVEKLNESGAWNEVRAQHRDYYLALAERSQTHAGPKQQYWLTRLDTEHDNLRAALDWCATGNADDPCLSLRLTAAVTDFWEIRGHNSEGRRHLERAFALDVRQERTVYRARALDALGTLCRTQSDFASAERHGEEALQIYQHLDDRKGISASFNRLGNIDYMRGQYASANARYEESLRGKRELNDDHGIALVLNNIANVIVHLEANSSAKVMALYEESLQIRRKLGDTRGIAYALAGMGRLATNDGDYAAGQSFHEESLSLRRELGDEPGIAESIGSLGNVALYQGEYGLAVELYEEARHLLRALGNRRALAMTLGNLASALRMKKDYNLSSTVYEESLTLGREIGNTVCIANAHLGLGIIAVARGDVTRAKSALDEGLPLFVEIGQKVWIADCLRSHAALCLLRSETAKAVRLYAASELLRESFAASQPFLDREQFEQQIATARGQLSADSFAAEWETGRALSWEEAVAYALAE